MITAPTIVDRLNSLVPQTTDFTSAQVSSGAIESGKLGLPTKTLSTGPFESGDDGSDGSCISTGVPNGNSDTPSPQASSFNGSAVTLQPLGAALGTADISSTEGTRMIPAKVSPVPEKMGGELATNGGEETHSATGRSNDDAASRSGDEAAPAQWNATSCLDTTSCQALLRELTEYVESRDDDQGLSGLSAPTGGRTVRTTDRPGAPGAGGDVRGVVRRPMNAFMIFSTRFRKALREKFPNEDNKTVSKMLGDLWATMPRELKLQYQSAAARIQAEHKAANPGWNYNQNSRKAATAASAAANEQAAAAAAAAGALSKDMSGGASAGVGSGAGNHYSHPHPHAHAQQAGLGMSGYPPQLHQVVPTHMHPNDWRGSHMYAAMQPDGQSGGDYASTLVGGPAGYAHMHSYGPGMGMPMDGPGVGANHRGHMGMPSRMPGSMAHEGGPMRGRPGMQGRPSPYPVHQHPGYGSGIREAYSRGGAESGLYYGQEPVMPLHSGGRVPYGRQAYSQGTNGLGDANDSHSSRSTAMASSGAGGGADSDGDQHSAHGAYAIAAPPISTTTHRVPVVQLPREDSPAHDGNGHYINRVELQQPQHRDGGAGMSSYYAQQQSQGQQQQTAYNEPFIGGGGIGSGRALNASQTDQGSAGGQYGFPGSQQWAQQN
eukprot:Opistho-2@21258